MDSVILKHEARSHGNRTGMIFLIILLIRLHSEFFLPVVFPMKFFFG